MNEKEKCEKVLTVFREYLQNTSEVEVLWSEKKQVYLVLQWYEDDSEDMKTVEDAEELCDLILNELYIDVYLGYGFQKTHYAGDWSLTEEAKTDLINRVQPYMEQLPEYKHLIDKLLES